MTESSNLLPYSYFAQVYGCDAYGANAYNECSTTTATNPTGSSQLADTGITVGIFIAVAVVIMGIALLVRAWRRKKKTPPKS